MLQAPEGHHEILMFFIVFPTPVFDWVTHYGPHAPHHVSRGLCATLSNYVVDWLRIASLDHITCGTRQDLVQAKS
jgi:hypothetical protein